ncbi:ComEA family DNA-binding protein [Nocardia donostiensis]|uniref:ComEA family DNA-binding protein n=2 Tax=Nocardia donostiensis TaxID=1538463 RepID=UPI0009D94ADA|nr:ComEA family DNA-binding protein [Nocardia donostiensis]
MSRHDERERIRQRLGGLTARVEAAKAGASWSVPHRPQLPAPLRPRIPVVPEAAAVRDQLGRSPGHPEPGAREEDRQRDEPHPGVGLRSLPHLPADARAPYQDPAEPEAGDRLVPAPSWLDGPGDTPHRWRDRLMPARFTRTRIDPGRRGVLTMAGVGVMAAMLAVGVALWQRPAAQPVPPLPMVRTAAAETTTAPRDAEPGATPLPQTAAAPTTTELVVSVVGLVHQAGLVRLPPGARVADAVAAAGGARAGADLTGLNLAQRLSDGDQVLVGAAPSGDTTPRLGSTTISGGTTSTGAAAGPGSARNPATPVNLNTATEPDLDTLPGVGPVTARAIISWRETNGRFTDIEQLAEVNGIGPARLERLRDLVTI